MKSHRKIISTWLRGKKVGTENAGTFLEGTQGPLIQHSDFTEAKQKCKRPYDEHTAITGDGNKPSPPAQPVRQKQAWSTIWRPRRNTITSTTHSSSSSHSQQSSDWKSNRSWDSWPTSSWTEQDFSVFFFVLRCHFACRKCNLLALDGECRQTHLPRTTFSHAQLLHRRVLYLLSESTVTHWPPCTCMAQVTKHTVCVPPKNIHTSSSSRNVVHLAEPDSTHRHSFLAFIFLKSLPATWTTLRRSTATAEWRPDGIATSHRLWAQPDCWRPELQTLHRRRSVHWTRGFTCQTLVLPPIDHSINLRLSGKHRDTPVVPNMELLCGNECTTKPRRCCRKVVNQSMAWGADFSVWRTCTGRSLLHCSKRGKISQRE